MRSPEERVAWVPPFQDQRLQALYVRYLGRNWPELLNDAQQTEWQSYLAQKLIDGNHGCQFTLDDFFAVMSETKPDDETQAEILAQLNLWAELNFSELNSASQEAV